MEKFKEKLQKKNGREEVLAGFTLIEMLVTLVLLSMILSMCYTVLFAATQAKEKIERQVEGGRIAEAIFSLLLRDLRGAYFYNQNLMFRSEEELSLQKIFFPSLVDIPKEGEKLRLIQYVLQKNPEDSNKLVLFRGMAPLEASGRAGEFRYEEVFDQIREMKYRFWKNGRWLEEWHETTPPVAVEITIKIMGKDRGEEKLNQKTYSTIHSFLPPPPLSKEDSKK